jgi:hypothetical protein
MVLRPALSTVAWVGAKDLEILFRVTDATTGKPVSNASVAVLCGDVWLYEDNVKPPFAMCANAAGVARHLCKGCRTCGRSGIEFKDTAPWIDLINTWHIYIPEWAVSASAPGYESSKPSYIATKEVADSAHRDKESAKVELHIELKPKQTH